MPADSLGEDRMTPEMTLEGLAFISEISKFYQDLFGIFVGSSWLVHGVDVIGTRLGVFGQFRSGKRINGWVWLC